MNSREYQNKPENRSHHDRAYDLLGEMLLEQETRALPDALDGEKADGSAAETAAIFARRDAKKHAKIDRYFRRQRTRRFSCKTLPKIGQAAAIIIAVLTLAGGVAIAINHTLRVQVMRPLTRVEEDTEASFDVPEEWEGE